MRLLVLAVVSAREKDLVALTSDVHLRPTVSLNSDLAL